MVYSEQWVNGNIQGNMIGKVPRDLLLLCLVSSRFIKASEQLLQGTARDLNVFDTIKAALQRWDLEDSYPNVSYSFRLFVLFLSNRSSTIVL